MLIWILKRKADSVNLHVEKFENVTKVSFEVGFAVTLGTCRVTKATYAQSSCTLPQVKN